MQSVSSRIWTRVAESISYDDNHYTTGTSNDCVIGHTRLSHSIVLKQEQQLQCLTPCTVKHILTECRTFALIRKQFFKGKSLEISVWQYQNEGRSVLERDRVEPKNTMKWNHVQTMKSCLSKILSTNYSLLNLKFYLQIIRF